MRTPSPPPSNSRSAAAAALLKLSQTPPQTAAIAREAMATPRHFEPYSTASSSPMPKSVGSPQYCDSDKGDPGLKVCNAYHDGNFVDDDDDDDDTVPELSSRAAHVQNRLPEVPAELAVPSSATKAATQRASQRMPRSLGRHVHVFSSPMSDSCDVTKVSNSDDENTAASAPAPAIFRNTSGDKIDAPQMLGAMSRIEDRLPQVQARPGVPSTEIPETIFAPGLAVVRRPNIAPVGRFSNTMVEGVHGMHSLGVPGPSNPAFPRGSDRPAHMSERAPETTQSTVMVGPDEFNPYLRQLPQFSQQGYGVSLRHASKPLHLASQPPQQPGYRPLLLSGTMTGPRHASQSPPHSQYTLPPANTGTEAPQQAHPPLPSAEETHQPSGLYGLPVPGLGVSEGVGGRRKVRIPRAPLKRAVAPPKIRAVKSPRDGFGPKEIDINDFRYRTIRAINMPARNDLTPGQDPPEPTPESRPYGDDFDYRANLLIWWCDDLGLSYNETVRRYRLRFPSEKTITEDTVRKKHILYLEKLARRHGLKPQNELEEPGPHILRRGRQAGHQYNTINGIRVYAATAGPDVAGTVRRRRRVTEPTQHKGMLKACICVWKDTSDASFEQIQQRLEHEYKWLVGVNTVQKMYYAERARVYDTYNETSTMPNQQAPYNMPDLGLLDLRAYYLQRKQHLLATSGEQVPQQDAVQMYHLEQLINSMERAQVWQAQQQTGQTQTIVGRQVGEKEPDTEEIVDVEEVDVPMQDVADADPGFVGDQGVDRHSGRVAVSI